MKKTFLLFFLSLFFQFSFAAVITRELHINADSLTAIDGSKFPYLAFNASNTFDQRNLTIVINKGDSLKLNVINHHSDSHEFKLKNHSSSVIQILPGDTTTAIYSFQNAGLYIFHDPLNFPANVYMGLGGMVVVKDHSHSSFYWNLKEHQKSFNDILDNGGNVDFSQYNPDYFTVNAMSNPQIDTDPSSRITGNVGDTIYLYMANSGLSIHSIHFHGYHAEIVQSSKNINHVGRSKDTFPIYSMQTLVVRFVPDKPGIYPLHNHNLVAVTGNKVYPNGMFSTILITP